MSIVERERTEEVAAPKEVTEADVLERAADLLGEYGWCQGFYGTITEGRPVSFCAVGAIWQAWEDLGVDSAAFGGRDFFPERALFPNTTDLVPVWNDARDRTKEEVVAALRNAAEKARS